MADEPVVQGSSIQVPTTDLGTPGTMAIITIAKQAMRILNAQSDPTVKQVAFEALQNCLRDVNIRNAFNFTVANDTDITLVQNQREYGIPDSAWTLKALGLVRQDGATPERLYPLGFIDWDQAQALFSWEDVGVPNFWCSEDVFMKRTVILPTAPSETAAADFKLRIWYLQGIPRPAINDEMITIAGPDVLSLIIQTYIEYRLLEVFGEPNDPRTNRKWVQYRDLLAQLRGLETRSQPGLNQIRLAQPQINSVGRNSRRGWYGG